MEGKKNGGRRGRKGPAGASESRQGSRLLLLLCGSSAGQPPASVQLQTSVSPAKKNEKKLGDQERHWPCLAVFGWQLASGTARLEGDLQLAKRRAWDQQPPSLTVALDRQLQIPDT